MIFRRSFSILSNNIDMLFKVLIYSFVLVIVCLALFVAIVNPLIGELNKSFDVIGQLKETLNGWLRGDGSGSFRAFFNDILRFFNGGSAKLRVSVVMFVLLYAMMKFFVALTYIPISKVLYNKMSTNYNEKFSSAFISSLGKSLLFALIYILVSVPLDIAVAAGGYYLIKVLYMGFSFLAFTVSIFVILLVVAAKIAIFNQWIPLIVCEDMSVLKAFAQSFRQSFKTFTSVYPSLALIVILMYAVIMCTTIITFAIFPIIATPAYMILSNGIGLTAYFKERNQKFYVNDKTIE